MATLHGSELHQPHVTVENYLHSSYEPDCDYVDGRIEERNVGLFNHSVIITAIMVAMHRRRDEWNAQVLPSLRLRVSPTRVRVSDLCLVNCNAPHEQVPTHPPILVIEVLDEQDRFGTTMEKLADYERFGVEYIWLVDPERREAFRYRLGGLERVQTGELAVQRTLIRVDLGEVFAELDRW